ncbi:hypothetical protein D3C78_1737360 [compost metagenome]
MKMQKVEGVDIPAGGTLTFAPGGYHLMLLGLKKPLAAEERFPVTLHFQKAGDVKVEILVQKEAPASGQTHDMHDMHGKHDMHDMNNMQMNHE